MEGKARSRECEAPGLEPTVRKQRERQILASSLPSSVILVPSPGHGALGNQGGSSPFS